MSCPCLHIGTGNIRDFEEGVPHAHPMSHQDVTCAGSVWLGPDSITRLRLLSTDAGQPQGGQPQGRQPGLCTKPRSCSALTAAVTGKAAAYQGTGEMQDRAHWSLSSPGQSEARAGCPLRRILGWLPPAASSSKVSETVCRHRTSSSLPKLSIVLHLLCNSIPCPIFCKIRCNFWGSEDSQYWESTAEDWSSPHPLVFLRVWDIPAMYSKSIL